MRSSSPHRGIPRFAFLHQNAPLHSMNTIPTHQNTSSFREDTALVVFNVLNPHACSKPVCARNGVCLCLACFSSRHHIFLHFAWLVHQKHTQTDQVAKKKPVKTHSHTQKQSTKIGCVVVPPQTCMHAMCLGGPATFCV
jgi:hypothetical protein